MSLEFSIKTLALFAIIFLSFADIYGEVSKTEQMDLDKSWKVLSRRKRFIIFPDGSSFQLVFCTQNHGYLQLGDIVWFGITAGLAWELPSNPDILLMFKDQKHDGNNRRSDVSKHIYYLDEDGKVISKVPYHKRPIVNPAFAKRSIDAVQMKNNRINISIKDMHNKTMNIDYLDQLHENSIEFHREGRKSLYVKLEKFFQGLGWNGRQCLLRILCETAKPVSKQGTFLEEIMRATFTLPRGRSFDSDVHMEYDKAHGTIKDCGEMYPSCEDANGLQLFEER